MSSGCQPNEAQPNSAQMKSDDFTVPHCDLRVDRTRRLGKRSPGASASVRRLDDYAIMGSWGAVVGRSCLSLSRSRSSITTSITTTDPAPAPAVRVWVRVRARASNSRCKSKSRRRCDYEEPQPQPESDHYAVLGVPRGATQAQIKRVYRLLALKHHPDVSNRSGPSPHPAHVFLSITAAYQVLSNEDTRAHYDMRTQFFRKTATEKYYRWGTDLRKRTRRYKQSTHNLYQEPVEHEEIPHENQGTFSGVLRFTFLALFLIKTVGQFVALLLFLLFSLMDRELDNGYKLGYLVSWLLGGRYGVVLMLFVRFASWLCGKNNSGRVVLVVLAFWVGVSLARFGLLPQGAVSALLYMSMKLQNDLK